MNIVSTLLPSTMNTLNNDCVKLICNFLEDPRPLSCVLNLSINEQKIVIDPLICMWETLRIMEATELLPFSFCGITGFENVKNAKQKFSFYLENVQESGLKDSIQKMFDIFENNLSAPMNFGCEWRFPEHIPRSFQASDPVKEIIPFCVEKVFEKKYITELQQEIQRETINPSFSYMFRQYEQTVQVYGKKKSSFHDEINKTLNKDAEILNWD